MTSQPPSPTTPPASLPVSPAIPLTPDLKAAYQNLYNKLETAIENTTDGAALTTLNAAQTNVDNILTKNAMYMLKANTALYAALLDQINSTNDDLEALQKQIMAITSKVSAFGEIADSINKVLSLATTV